MDIPAQIHFTTPEDFFVKIGHLDHLGVIATNDMDRYNYPRQSHPWLSKC